MIFSTRYKFGACMIPKVMSTIMTAVICYLQEDKAFIEHHRTIPTESYTTRFCKQTIERRKMSSWTKEFNQDNEYKTFSFVREPIDRLLSAFVDKCVVEHREKPKKFHLDCYGCKEDIECFIYKMKNRLWKYIEGQHTLSIMDKHVIPQTWHCEMKENIQKYRIFRYVSSSSTEYPTFLDDLSLILKDQNVPQKHISYVIDSLISGVSPHSTSTSYVRRQYKTKLTSRPDLIKILVDLYYYDFVTFGFTVPNFKGL